MKKNKYKIYRTLIMKKISEKSLTEQLRKYKFSFLGYQFAIFDFVSSFLGTFLLIQLIRIFYPRILREIISIPTLYLWTIPIGIVVHLLVGQQTPLNRAFLNLKGDYVMKLIILVLIMAGLNYLPARSRLKFKII